MPTFADGREMLSSHILQFIQGQLVHVTVPMAHNKRKQLLYADVLARILIVDRDKRMLRVRYLNGGLRNACGWESMGRVRLSGNQT